MSGALGLAGGPSAIAASQVTPGSPAVPWGQHSGCPHSGKGGRPQATFWGSWEAIGDKFTLPHCARRPPRGWTCDSPSTTLWGRTRKLPKTHRGSHTPCARLCSSTALGPLTASSWHTTVAVGMRELQLWLCLGIGSSVCLRGGSLGASHHVLAPFTEGLISTGTYLPATSIPPPPPPPGATGTSKGW